MFIFSGLKRGPEFPATMEEQQKGTRTLEHVESQAARTRFKRELKEAAIV
jgi:hypothetical protein